MRKISALLALLFVLAQINLDAQKDIKKITLSVVDTTQTKYEQAYKIYNWITTNIKYDVKSFSRNHYPEKGLDKLLSSGKGLCYDYSSLFKAMCNSVGIEAYTIEGYIKSVYYYSGQPFLRAEHSWNVFNDGESWHIVDATWGSGHTVQKPDFISTVLHHSLRLPYSNDKLVFIPAQNTGYFDISADEIAKTHYPLDPKWFFSASPLRFSSFEDDSTNLHFQYPLFTEAVDSSRGKSEEMVYKLDGIKGNKINKLNYFDLASGYLMVDGLYDLERDITDGNEWQFEKYASDYSIIFNAINKHKTITDSVYHSRFKSLRVMASKQKRMTNKIKSKAKSAKKSFKTKKQQILGKNVSYKRKQEGYLINIGRAELKRLDPDEKHDSVGADIQELQSLAKEAKALQKEEYGFIREADSLFGSINAHIHDDAKYDDTIYSKNRKFNFNIVSLNGMVLSNDEVTIRKYVDSLGYVYGEISTLLDQKKDTKSKLQSTSILFYTATAGYQKLLKQQLSLFSKMYKLSNYNDSILDKNNKCVSDLINSYKQSIDFTKKMANHGLLQKDIRKNNLEALKQQKRGIVKENKYFLKWYNTLYEREQAKYNSEKELAKNIKSIARKNLKLVQTKLKKFHDQKS